MLSRKSFDFLDEPAEPKSEFLSIFELLENGLSFKIFELIRILNDQNLKQTLVNRRIIRGNLPQLEINSIYLKELGRWCSQLGIKFHPADNTTQATRRENLGQVMEEINSLPLFGGLYDRVLTHFTIAIDQARRGIDKDTNLRIRGNAIDLEGIIAGLILEYNFNEEEIRQLFSYIQNNALKDLNMEHLGDRINFEILFRKIMDSLGAIKSRH